MSRELQRPVSDLPRLTSTPGIHGRIRSCPEDFRVEELPLYEATGDGEHAMLLIKKRELTTPRLVQLLGRSLGMTDRDIGVAGRKDSFAVTSQFVTVPAKSLNSLEPDAIQAQLNLVEQLTSGQELRVLSAARHRNKLKTGHLAGNRFLIVLRLENASPAPALNSVETILAEIERNGFPNYFGEQRFGHSNNSDGDGFRLLCGEKVRRLNRTALRFTLSAAQSRLFNEWTARRIEEGLATTVLPGDVMQVVESGGCFVVEAGRLASEQSRFDQRETVLTGPMFGPKMKVACGEPADREAAILSAASLTGDEFANFRKMTAGARRPMLVWPQELDVKQTGETELLLSFILPPGTYATSLLREVIHEPALPRTAAF